MKAAPAFATIVSLSTGAMAQLDSSTLSIGCARAREMVSSRGAVVLRMGPATYDCDVRDDSFCLRDEAAPLAWIRTVDEAQCPVGRVCRSQQEATGYE